MTCGCGKRYHASKRLARKALTSMKSSGRPLGNLHAYRCPDGNGWHLGNATTQHRMWVRSA